MGRTQIWDVRTDRLTDGRTDKAATTCSPDFFSGSIKMFFILARKAIGDIGDLRK